MTTDHAEYAVTQPVGLPETRLPYELLATLPASAPPAPWRTTGEIISWSHPLSAEAIPAFPEPIRPSGGATVTWDLMRHTDSPVGPYSEIAATLTAADGDGSGHIPFVAVDSLASIVGGRATWLLPKTLATFDWSADFRTVTITGEQAEAPTWSITVSCSPTGDPADGETTTHVQQVSSDGTVRRFDRDASGSRRAAAVEVSGRSEGPLPLLLHAGRYDGSVMSGADLTFGALAAV